MADSFNVENLTNRELRAKCVEYGLPNVPVTDTSRGVLLRKLLEAMTTAPKTTTQNPANRRSTIMHVSTPTSHVVDAAATQQRSPPNRAKPSILKQSPLVLAPRLDRKYISLSKGGLTKTSFGQGAGDAYSPQPVRVERVSETDSDSESIPRSNRSVSLSRSEVVTTSYVQETVPIKSYVTDAAARSDHYRPSQPKPQPQPQLYPNLLHIADLNNLTKPSTSHIDNAPHFDAKLNRFVPADHLMPRSRFTTSATERPFPTLEEFRPLGVNVSKSSGVRKRTEEPRAPIQRSEYKQESDDTEDDEDDIEMVNLSSDNTEGEMSSEDSNGGAFYTSKFARHLERKHRVESSSASSPIVAPRKPIGTQKGDVALRDIMTALERKYHLKQSFALILCFLLSVFVYIFFLQ